MYPTTPHTFNSTDSLEEALLPSRETEAEIIFTPQLLPKSPPELSSSSKASVKLGGADLGAPGHLIQDPEEEGMIMGPSHPIFNKDNRYPDSRDLPVPPGARFDPISPVGPGFYSPGDPDFDELVPPGMGQNPLGTSVRPPRKNTGSKTFNAPSFGHPHGAPPGPGNPPFFM
jgi:hypothetical protein